jgi:Ferric reductase like transmembrane component
MIAAAVTGPSAMWYLTRGTGVVALVLLTLSVALGVANVRRMQTAEMPRFVLGAIHRNASLLAVVFLLVHIGTSLLDGFAPIALLDVIVPFRSAYRPLWLGFGAVAFDLLIAVTVTSLLRRRFGYRAWRATHWAAYACWPVALLHGLGTGSDAKTTWMLAITGVCVIVVIVAVVARVTDGWPEHAGARATALLASAMVPLGLLVWLPSGPLAAGWAKRAGTPSTLLPAATASAAPAASASAGSGSSGSGSGSGSQSSGSRVSFTAPVSGTLRQGQADGGLVEVHIALTVAGEHLGTLGIRIRGQAADGGGVAMSSSRVALGPASDPGQYRGQVTSLQGTSIAATVHDASGASLQLLARLQIDSASGSVSGSLTAGGG